MDTLEFDAALGGTEQLPDSANSLKFAVSRSIEIAAMTESILRPSKTKLIFQSLPVHMRRRVMSHNCKRLPRKLREGHMEQLKKSGLPPKQKRPSRKYRRRPGNLLEEYTRRQKKHVWLETHIWHAKRFHMIERWGHRLAYSPCDKAFRACYRATSAHCLLQDISYYTPIEITGPPNIIKDMFTSITSCYCGLGVCAKAYINGSRKGSIHLYQPNMYPFGYIGKVKFIWVSKDSTIKSLWLFVHPSQTNQVKDVFTDLLSGNIFSNENSCSEKRRKLTSYSETLKINIYPGTFNIFRLTGPNSHAILAQSLKCLDSNEKLAPSKWVSKINETNGLDLNEKLHYWQSINTIKSPSQLPAGVVIGLIVRDPRLSRPQHRTKAKNNLNDSTSIESLLNVLPGISSSPLWDIKLQEIIKKEKLTNAQFIEHISKNQLVPGAVYEDDPALQCVPVVLMQRPGSQEPRVKKIGYSCGWDIIIPSGYGLQFWQTFIMFGARSGGLRESESLAFEKGKCYINPDSCAGLEEEKRIKNELKEKYFRLPPSKRPNYIKLGINSPFSCQWKLLLSDWSNTSVHDFFVMRDKKLLVDLQSNINHKKQLPYIENASKCLLPVYLQISGKGALKKHALICLPNQGDISSIKTLFEPQHEDRNEKLRKQKRQEHKKNFKKMRRKRIKLKLKIKPATGTVQKTKKHAETEPSDFVMRMRELWVPTDIKNVRHSCSRQVLGYLLQAAFSYSQAQTCGVGYVAYNALNALLQSGQNQVLVRNTSSKKYWLASIQIINET